MFALFLTISHSFSERDQCKVGGAVFAAHSEGNQMLADACRNADFTVRREQIVPELATQPCLSPQLV